MKKKVLPIIVILLAFSGAAYFLITYGTQKFAGTTLCLSGVALVFLVIVLTELSRKYPPWETYKLRALRHVQLEPEQASIDFYAALQFLPPAKKFKGLVSFFTAWNQVSPELAQRSLINLIRITPVVERQSMGGNYPKSMANFEKQLSEEASAAASRGDAVNSLRKQLYYSYFMESKIDSMFKNKQTSDATEAMFDGFKKGMERIKMAGMVEKIRSDAKAAGTAVTLIACSECLQIVSEDHNPKHKRKMYPIYMLPDEVISVQKAFEKRYAPVK